MRTVLLGEDPPVALTDRARKVLASQREAEGHTVRPAGTAIVREGTDLRWFTWAGFRANATLAATLGDLVDGTQRVNTVSIRMRDDLTREMWAAATVDAASRLVLPAVDRRALDGLKFAEALPRRLAEATLAARLSDPKGAAQAVREPMTWGR